VEVSFENLIMIQLWMECLRRSPGVDSQSVDIGHGGGIAHGCISALGAAPEQVISEDIQVTLL
jgi:hypothetical protein